MSKLRLDRPNPALLSLIENYHQVLPLDTNILIPPDRSNELKSPNQPPLAFTMYKKHFLDPLLLTFPHLTIHEAVYDECIDSALRRFVTDEIRMQRLMLLKDRDLTPHEEMIRNSIEQKIAPHTRYNPKLNRGDDKGEVKSLAHIAAKGYIYFCSRDAKALRLIDEAETLGTNLTDQLSVHKFEILYYMFKVKIAEQPNFLKGLYKYLYRQSSYEVANNPEWGEFVRIMDIHYLQAITKADKPSRIRVS